MLTTLADRTVTVIRRTAYVVDPVAAAASVTLDRAPARVGLLRVTLASGTSGTGTVTITGTVGGVAGQSEVLTFTGNGSKSTTKQFSAISTITTTGLADESTPPTLSVQSIGPDGNPQPTSYTLASNWPATRSTTSGRWPSPTQGSSPEQPYVYLIEYTEVWTPRRGDLLRDDSTGEDWLIQTAPLARGPSRRGHWRIETTAFQA